MNREILFKAKRKDNSEWIYGNLIYKRCLRDNGLPEIYYKDWTEEYAYIYEDNAENNIEEYPTKFIEVIPETVCQYTGLKDKNDVKIFENDLIDCSWLPGYSSLEVIFTEGSFYLRDNSNRRHISFAEVIERIKGNVQGNIQIVGNAFDKEEK